MKKLALGISSLLLVLVAMPVGAQEVTCDDIAFDTQAMTAYPMIREACLDVVEHEGARYAHLVARVRQAGPPSMLVMFKHRDDTWGPATRITPAADANAYVGGEMVRAATVPAGSEVSIFLPEGRWEVAMSDADEVMIAEAEFAPIELEVTAEELPEEIPSEVGETATAAAAAVQEAGEEAAAGDALEEVSEAAEDAYEGAADSEWLWILGLAGAFIIVWFLLRRRKARREG